MGFLDDLNKLAKEVQGVRKELNGLKSEVVQSVKTVASEAAGVKKETVKQAEDLSNTLKNKSDRST